MNIYRIYAMQSFHLSYWNILIFFHCIDSIWCTRNYDLHAIRRQKEHSFFKIELQASKYWTAQRESHVGGVSYLSVGCWQMSFVHWSHIHFSFSPFPFYFSPLPSVTRLFCGCPFFPETAACNFHATFPKAFPGEKRGSTEVETGG